MCQTPDGRLYVIWIDTRGEEGLADIWMNRSLDQGREWLESPIKVKQGLGNAFNPNMDCTDDRVYIVWEDDRDGELEYKNIYFQTSADDGETWLPEDINLDIDPEGLTISQGPQVTAQGGSVHVVWSDNINGAPDIYASSSQNQGVSFSEPIRVDSDEPGVAYSGKPQLASDALGNVYVLWEDSRDGAIDLYFSASNDQGSSWNPDQRIDQGDDPGSNNSFGPTIGADEGNVYIAWHDDRNGVGRDIFLNYSADAGATFLEEVSRVDSDNAGFFDSLFPALLVEGDVAHVVWQDARNTGFDIFYRVATAGVFDTAEEGLEFRLDRDQEGFGNSINPRIVSGAGVMTVGWEDFRADPGEGYNDLHYNFLTTGGEEPEWSGEDYRVDSVFEGTSYAVDASWAVNEVDAAVEVLTSWADGRNGTGDIYFSHVIVGESADELLEYEYE